ncbi:MAG: hypothetical protein LUE98_18910 [Tannerellaceae bacterium]|nr:hypothetical protein [Tannerellaceae bacterium]
MNVFFGEEIGMIMIITSRLYTDEKGNDISYGGSILAFTDDNGLTEVEKHLFAMAINLKYREVAVEDWIKKLNNDIRKETVKSAKAAIMARNMSHNLGSHVMAYLKRDLESVKSIMQKKMLQHFFAIGDDLKTIEKNIIKLKKNANGIELPFLVGLGCFISYMQERQDFIATIATDYIPYSLNVNFKDAIYDELSLDLRYERHKDREGHTPFNFLLDNIARSEGLRRENIIIKFRKFNGTNDIKNRYKACGKRYWI